MSVPHGRSQLTYRIYPDGLFASQTTIEYEHREEGVHLHFTLS